MCHNRFTERFNFAWDGFLKGFDASTKIGYQNTTTGQFYILGDEDWGFEGFATEGKGYANGSLAVNDMINGNIDYVIVDNGPAKAIAATMNGTK